MDVRKLFTQQLNYRFVNQLIDSNLFAGRFTADNTPTDARVMFEGRGVQVLRVTLPKLHNESEKACIRALRKDHPDAVYLFADVVKDSDKTIYHLCNDAGKQLPLSPQKKLLFADKVKFFEVTDDLTGTLELQERIAKAFETEKITKRFYNEFKTYREKLVKFIQGIPLAEKEERNWYASVLLNRLMFIYFIQKRGFINQDENWLSRRLAEHEQARKPFYTDFLMPLFFSGFDKRPGERGAHEAAFAGVPYLNGGLFQRHPLEDRYPEISIDNKVLRELLDYFDKYRWYLDDRELRDENEINPDVLGFIFEKYVNQKQMGAYYTKEDITGYICRNTILPFLLNKLANTTEGQPAPLPFPITSENIERFIYDAVKTESHLPTETEREYAARRKRFAGIKADAAAGKIALVNDLITYNLDIVTYVDDAIAQMDERSLKRFYFGGLNELTVLDPTCGSGAFLFAALNILLPLYLTALQRMHKFADVKSKTGNKEAHAGLTNEYAAFETELRRIAQHDNERYYIIKTIIVNNLYGVDIMEEATEICKLRLFLRLASEIKDPSQIEPLPDIDFNIKAGNTLVGFANRDDVTRALSTHQRVKDGQVVAQGKLLSGDTLAEDAVAEVERKCAEADREFQRYHELQTERNISARELAQAKYDLRAKMKALNATLDRALAREYGVTLPSEPAEASTKAGKKGKTPLNTLGESAAFVKWKESHQPFHWFAEFYGILVDKGGFNVIVGNPPYVEYRLVQPVYRVIGIRSENCGNLYGFVMERSAMMLHERSHIGMIVPAGLMGLDDSSTLRSELFKVLSNSHFSSYAIRPSKLFEGVDQRLCIYVGSKELAGNHIFTTKYHHWNAEERELLFSLLDYSESFLQPKLKRIPQLGSLHSKSILKKLESIGTKCVADYFSISSSKYSLIHYHRSPRYWIRAMNFEQYFKSATRSKSVYHFRDLWFKDETSGKVAGAAINSSLFFWWFISIGNGRNITSVDIEQFPIGDVYSSTLKPLIGLFDKLMKDYQKNSVIRERSDCEYQEFRPSLSKPILDEIDKVFAKHYGFTDEELDFIINYDIKYRMGRDAEADDE